MPATPEPRFTDLADFEAYLRTSGAGTVKQTVLPIVLASAERFVERFCRRRFAPEPKLSDTYTRQVVQVAGNVGTSLPPQVAGSLTLTWGSGGPSTGPLPLPLTATALYAAIVALAGVGAGNVVCSGGPLPSYPISVTWAGALTGEQALLSADSSGLSGGYAIVQDAGYDSLPPVAKRFTTKGRLEVRVPDLRAVDASPDPRLPNSGGVVLYGRRLLPSQYDAGYASYPAFGADEAIGSSYAEPATEIRLGYGYATGISLAQQFAYVLPMGFFPNDLTITGRWGWTPAPDDLTEAVYAVGARRWAERNAAFSDQMMSAEGAVLAYYKQLPASVQATLSTYRVPNISIV